MAYQTAYLKANYTVEYMASVLTAFRDNAEKVAAAVAECRRLGIPVLAPDVHASHLEFTVEGAAIRFGLLAVKNVGQGAIESIIAAREEGGPFRSFADFCNRIDLRLVNKRVLESLVKVGALNRFGHPAQLLLALDDVLAAAQADQRERASGQISFFDLAAEPAALEAPLPTATEVPVRERLRWEKELLGLYLSDHPLGEVAERIGRFVTIYSGELRDESLDGQRVVVGGVVTGVRSVVTKARSTMAVATLEDLQGSLEVVVFPKLYEQTGPTWQEGAILLVAGRIDHRGEEVSVLADLVRDFDAASASGEESFAAEVAAADRGRGRGRPGGNGNGHGHDDAPSARQAAAGQAAVGQAGAQRSGAPPGAPARNSPIRGTAPAPPAAGTGGALPPGPCRWRRNRCPAPQSHATSRPSRPTGRSRYSPRRRAQRPCRRPERPPFRERPGPRAACTSGLGRAAHGRPAGSDGRGPRRPAQPARHHGRHDPPAAGDRPPALPMELRVGVAYDAELIAEVTRRLRAGVVDLVLAADAGGIATPA